MSLNNVIRQSHRWVSMAFTAGVIINIVAMTQKKEPAAWIGALALVPLILLLLSGLYLFVLPYVTKRRDRGADPDLARQV